MTEISTEQLLAWQEDLEYLSQLRQGYTKHRCADYAPDGMDSLEHGISIEVYGEPKKHISLLYSGGIIPAIPALLKELIDSRPDKEQASKAWEREKAALDEQLTQQMKLEIHTTKLFRQD